jgi:uncharacterized protein
METGAAQLQELLVLPGGVDWHTVLLVNAIIGAAAFMSSLTGFGYALVATPFMVLLYEPRTVVPVVIVSWIPLAVLLVTEARSRMQPARIGRWSLGAVIGLPVGVYGLAAADPGTMRIAIGAMTLLAALTLWVKPARPLQHEGLFAPLTGLVSGVMGGATGMSGPPVILFGLNQQWDHRDLRANLIGYFAVKHALGLVFLTEFGILNRQTLSLGVAALPGMLLGYVVGIHLKERVSQRSFRALALTLVCSGGVAALIKH